MTEYQVMLSNGYESDTFNVDSLEKAEMLYNMAVDSRRFCYVCIYKNKSFAYVVKDWGEEFDEP